MFDQKEWEKELKIIDKLFIIYGIAMSKCGRKGRRRDPMRVEQIVYLNEIHKQMSLHKAAENLHLSPQALEPVDEYFGAGVGDGAVDPHKKRDIFDKARDAGAFSGLPFYRSCYIISKMPRRKRILSWLPV